MRLTVTLHRRLGKWSSMFSNYPEKFVERYLEDGGRMPLPDPLAGKPQRCPKLPKTPRNYYMDMARPWTAQFAMNNSTRQPLIPLEPILKWSFFRGDMVEILDGPDKGKQGKVKYICEERNFVTVDGLNTKMKVIRKDGHSFALRYEMPLLVTKQVRLVDPSDLKGTDIAWRYTENGEEVRVSLRTGRIIPIPGSAYETKDYTTPDTYKNNPTKDTDKKLVEEVTFQPEHCTFEMDIMKRMGIEETRIPKKYYWY